MIFIPNTQAVQKQNEIKTANAWNFLDMDTGHTHSKPESCNSVGHEIMDK